MTGCVEGISFDLWDTLFIDDSDEAIRASRGMRTKRDERRFLVRQALSRHHQITPAELGLAYDVVDAAFRKVWHDQHVTWSVRQRLGVLLDGLQMSLPEPELAELVRLHEDMELGVRPGLVPGVREALESLQGRYKLAVISDAIFSPGRALRELLRGEDLLRYFSVLLFSDELGCCKPDRRVFEQAARELGVSLGHLVHIGDREHNDVKGAQAAGARTVLFTAVKRREQTTVADAVCHRYEDLPHIIEQMGSKRPAG